MNAKDEPAEVLPDPDVPEPIVGDMGMAFTAATRLRTSTSKLVLLGLAHLGRFAEPDEVAALTGLNRDLTASTLRELAKSNHPVVRKAWLDENERKKAAYRFQVTP